MRIDGLDMDVTKCARCGGVRVVFKFSAQGPIDGAEAPMCLTDEQLEETAAVFLSHARQRGMITSVIGRSVELEREQRKRGG